MCTLRLIVSRVALAILFGAGLCTATLAAGDAGGRYTMSPTEDGVVRLDTQTGAMALCQRKHDKWACEDMEDSQHKLRSQIGKLQAENKSLKDQVQHLEERLGQGENQPDTPSPGAKFVLPNEADVDKAFDYFERMAKKLHERMQKLEEQHSRKPDTAL